MIFKSFSVLLVCIFPELGRSEPIVTDVQTLSESQSDVDNKVDQDEEKGHVIDSVDLLVYLCLLILTIVTLWIFKKKRLWFLHETGLSIIFGLIVGAILRYSSPPTHQLQVDVTPISTNSSLSNPPDVLRLKLNNSDGSGVVFSYNLKGVESGSPSSYNDIQEKATFDPEIFFYVILPPIIFHAGYSMRKKHFFENLGAILTFALLGTVISTLVIAGFMYGVVQLISIEMKFLDCLFFGSIISATDPVTVLAIFNDLNVDTMLNGLLLGESLLNDAVAIVLCRSIEDYHNMSSDGGASFEFKAFLRTIGEFFGIFLGSVGLGAFMGAATSLLTKFTHVRDYQLLETSLFFLMSYSSYLLGEVCEMSGIVAVLFCGIFQAHYTFHNLSLESKLRTKQLFEVLNFLCENFIFSYIGVSMFTFSRHKFNFIFIFGAFIAIIIARAANIYPLSFLLNLGRRKKIPAKFQHMMWFSGLRGALAFGLAMKNTVSTARQMFLTTTSLIALVTTVFCGGMTTPLLNWLDIPVGVNHDLADDTTEAESCLDDELPQIVNEGNRKYRSCLARYWKTLDSNLIQPLLTNSQPTLIDTFPSWLGWLGRFFTTEDQLVSGHHNRAVSDGDLICPARDGTTTNSLSSGD